jgi:hypothetical protein
MEQYFTKPAANIISPESSKKVINLPTPKRDTQVHDATQ